MNSWQSGDLRPKMSDYVLDASAILALIFAETGKERVEQVLDNSSIGRINVTEALTKMLERGSTIEDALESLDDLGLDIIEFDAAQSKQVAQLRSITKLFGLSLGDRACLALAIQNNAVAVTADKDWAKLDICKVEVIR